MIDAYYDDDDDTVEWSCAGQCRDHWLQSSSEHQWTLISDNDSGHETTPTTIFITIWINQN